MDTPALNSRKSVKQNIGSDNNLVFSSAAAKELKFLQDKIFVAQFGSTVTLQSTPPSPLLLPRLDNINVKRQGLP